jgi:hypothetical protein
MRVRVWKNTLDNAPKAVSSRFLPPVRLPITVGTEYEVMALVQSGELAMLQIVDDDDFPMWLPAWFSDVVDSTIPADWICNILGDERGIALGPKFVVKDIESYGQMVLLEPDPVAKFWARVERIEKGRQVVRRLVDILNEIATELEPYSEGLQKEPDEGRAHGTEATGNSMKSAARPAALWRQKLMTLALGLESHQSELGPEERANLSNTFFDAPDALVHFSVSEQEFPGASQTNVRLLELIAALYEVMA